MNDETRRKASRKGLTHTRICTAALVIIDDEGLPALNMRRLGAALGVDAMALYRHVPSKQAILEGVVDLVLADLADGGGEARERAHRFFSSLRGVLAAHPNAIPLVANAALQTGAAKQRADRLLAAMRESGLGVEQSFDAFHTLESFALGYAWLEVAGFVGELPEDAPFVRSNVPPGAVAAGPSGGVDGRGSAMVAGDRYDRCLRAILDVLVPT